MNNHEALELVAALERALDGATTRMTSLVSQLAGLALNSVLRSELVILDANGRAQVNASVPFASVGLWAYDGDVTAHAGPEQQTAPTSGIGVIAIPAQRAAVWPLTGPTLTIYGTAGQRVLVTLWSAPQVPSVAFNSAGGSVDGGGA